MIQPEDRELAANQDCIDNRVEAFATEIALRFLSLSS